MQQRFFGIFGGKIFVEVVFISARDTGDFLDGFMRNNVIPRARRAADRARDAENEAEKQRYAARREAAVVLFAFFFHNAFFALFLFFFQQFFALGFLFRIRHDIFSSRSRFL